MHNLGFMSQLTQNGSFHVDIFPSQSVGLVLKKLNLTQQKQTTQEQNGKLEAKDVLPNINCTQPPKGPKMSFLSLVTLTSDLGFQTRPSERPIMSSM